MHEADIQMHTSVLVIYHQTVAHIRMRPHALAPNGVIDAQVPCMLADNHNTQSRFDIGCSTGGRCNDDCFALIQGASNVQCEEALQIGGRNACHLRNGAHGSN